MYDAPNHSVLIVMFGFDINSTHQYPIRNWPLLIKSGVTLIFVISFFFLHSVPDIQKLSLGWTALLGAVLLLILSDRDDLESVLARVEWSTLLFFAALFVLMESLSELGLIDWIGTQTELIILSVDEESRLAVAILIILWVSAIASAFVDNIPLTTMMVKVAISLAEKKALNLPLQPLVWAMAFGACLGGVYKDIANDKENARNLTPILQNHLSFCFQETER